MLRKVSLLAIGATFLAAPTAFAGSIPAAPISEVVGTVDGDPTDGVEATLDTQGVSIKAEGSSGTPPTGTLDTNNDTAPDGIVLGESFGIFGPIEKSASKKKLTSKSTKKSKPKPRVRKKKKVVKEAANA